MIVEQQQQNLLQACANWLVLKRGIWSSSAHLFVPPQNAVSSNSPLQKTLFQLNINILNMEHYGTFHPKQQASTSVCRVVRGRDQAGGDEP